MTVDLHVVPASNAAVVGDCADHGIDHIWLFKGIGGPGAVSEDALAVCEERGLDVVAGACPLMFLEPVGWFHRLHRSARKARRDLIDVPDRPPQVAQRSGTRHVSDVPPS